MEIEVREYEKGYRTDLVDLFAELQRFEKSIYSGRADPTNEFMDKLTNELLSEVKSKNGKVYLAFDGDKPVGFIAGYVEKDTENDTDYFRIDSFFVSEKYRSKGIGKRLINRIEKYVLSVGQSKIGLGVLIGNKYAYEYYKKLGFKDYGIEILKDL